MKLWLWPLAIAAAWGQVSDVPYDRGPTFANEKTVATYPGLFASIRGIDFRNFRFLSFDETRNGFVSEELKNGHFQRDDEFHYSSDLALVQYLPSPPSSSGEYALVLLAWSGVSGSSSSGGKAKVFRLSSHHLRAIQEINWDTHFQAGGPTHSFDPATNTLVIRSAHYIPGDAHCCVSAMDVVSFRWDGARFVQTGLQTKLSEYGKKEGKQLGRSARR